ncbi:type I-G CRISPR-associated protein Csb2 [Brockia lithotrophica]|uniref:CRISPR-associated protein Csb2 n=1 Tax=Brockia lithotrophica TaxID=933949 RepID=A0A660L531_9BACL|nr:type I-U CRISPR-associated protein Csb2 [Brockia lithotrophica]RKQ89037.1 CRISPR-associated protein Csb2 [Brockia lithotrophica]
MPFVLRVDFLNGFVTGSRGLREQLEYPPHPDRLFMALVATAGKTRTYDAGKGTYVRKIEHPRYRNALTWLEAQKPPRIYAPRTPLDVWLLRIHVPVNYTYLLTKKEKNDKNDQNDLSPSEKDTRRRGNQTHKKIQKKFVLPPFNNGARDRVPRVRPLGIIDRPIFYEWTEKAPPEIADALGELAKDVPYLGTTWSSVAVRVVPEVEEPFCSASFLRPLEETDLTLMQDMEVDTLRVPFPGRLELLDREYERVIEFLNRTLPRVSKTRRSRSASKTREIPMKTYLGASLVPYVWVERRGPEDGHVLARSAIARFRLKPSLPLVWSGLLGEAVHAVLARVVNGLRRRFLNVNVEEYATGSGSFRKSLHVGMVPLAHVGTSFSTGEIKGFALFFPESEGITREIVEAIYEAFLRGIATSEGMLYLDFAQVKSEGTLWPPQRRVEFQVEPLDDRPVFVRDFGGDDKFSADPSKPSPGDWERQKKTTKKPPSTLYSLRWSRWKRASNLWASVTPVILPRFPKKHVPILQIVNESLQALGYPEVLRVTYRPVGALTGTPSVHDFRAFGARYLDNVWMHLVLEFERAISGPVVVGKGIYFGYGFFAPVVQGRERDDA